MMYYLKIMYHSNYLMIFWSRKIFKLINKNTDKGIKKNGHLNLKNPLLDDENLQ